MAKAKTTTRTSVTLTLSAKEAEEFENCLFNHVDWSKDGAQIAERIWDLLQALDKAE